MKIIINIESPSLGEITIESPNYAEEAGQNIRTLAAAVLVDTLVPRTLGALQVKPQEDPAEEEHTIRGPLNPRPEAPVSESIDE